MDQALWRKVQLPEWTRRIPIPAWLTAAALFINTFSTVLWPALETLWCKTRTISGTTVHPNGTVEEVLPPFPCNQGFWQTFQINADNWWFESFLFPLFGQHLLAPGNYDDNAWLGWLVWLASLASFALALHFTRHHRTARSFWWRIPLAYLVAAIVSGSWIQEWEHFD